MARAMVHASSSLSPTASARSGKLFRRAASGIEAAALCRRSHWVPKSSRSTCAACRRGFRLWDAKHHCRLCGEVVCGACSTGRVLFRSKRVRACDECVAAEGEIFAVMGSRRQSLPDLRFQAHSAPTLLSSSRRSMPVLPEAGDKSRRRSRTELKDAATSERRAVVRWSWAHGQFTSLLLVLCAVFLACLASVAARR